MLLGVGKMIGAEGIDYARDHASPFIFDEMVDQKIHGDSRKKKSKEQSQVMDNDFV